MSQTAGLFYKCNWHKMEYTEIRKISIKEKVRRKKIWGNYILALTIISLIVGVGLPPAFSRVIAKASTLPKDFIF